MRCIVCKQGETWLGKKTVTLERGNTILVLKNVPAHICEDCGEPYFESAITADVLRLADEAVQAGVQLEVREYQPINSTVQE